LGRYIKAYYKILEGKDTLIDECQKRNIIGGKIVNRLKDKIAIATRSRKQSGWC